jgi:hypothetical protein
MTEMMRLAAFVGLALEQREASGVEVVGIDHAERPTLN